MAYIRYIKDIDKISNELEKIRKFMIDNDIGIRWLRDNYPHLQRYYYMGTFNYKKNEYFKITVSRKTDKTLENFWDIIIEKSNKEKNNKEIKEITNE